MARSVTHERELRSLDRPGLRHAFRPLDAAELPRELVVDPGIAVTSIGRRLIVLLVPAASLTAVTVILLILR